MKAARRAPQRERRGFARRRPGRCEARRWARRKEPHRGGSTVKVDSSASRSACVRRARAGCRGGRKYGCRGRDRAGRGPLAGRTSARGRGTGWRGRPRRSRLGDPLLLASLIAWPGPGRESWPRSRKHSRRAESAGLLPRSRRGPAARARFCAVGRGEVRERAGQRLGVATDRRSARPRDRRSGPTSRRRAGTPRREPGGRRFEQDDPEGSSRVGKAKTSACAKWAGISA